MNKEIKEMASSIEEGLIEAKDTLGSMNEGEGKWLAEHLHKLGYRKVVGGEGYRQYSDSSLANFSKDLLIGVIRSLEYNWQTAEADVKRQTENFKRLLKIEKQATAKEILQKLKNKFDGFQVTYYDGTEEVWNYVDEMISDFAKDEYGIDLN